MTNPIGFGATKSQVVKNLAKVYEGLSDGCSDGPVCVHQIDTSTYPLNPRLDLRPHSPTGFAWGYAGSGPSQLAVAILADYYGDDHFALARYMAFEFAVIASLDPTKGWKLTGSDIEKAVLRQ